MPQHPNSAPGPRRYVIDPLGADETIIVGAGIAGLACARRLHDAGRRFLLVSENVGGRLHRSSDGTVNLGAYYVRADYTHVTRYVRPGRRINRLVTRRHDGDTAYGYWNPRLMLHSKEAARLLGLLMEFRRRYDTLKHRTIDLGQAAAIRSDSMLSELYRTPATEFIREHRLEALARWYLAPGIHGTAFTSLNEITAFTLLLGAMPALIPTYEFTLDL
ncbi:MAG: NAD(P)-binding protein, partial [Acidimicrobiia bacterium]|nr:NAD(P)-binding protein [Acidimicrobiia bacterium]